MGSGLTVKAEWYFSKVLKSEIEKEIYSKQYLIRKIQDMVLILAASTPREVKEEGHDAVSWEEYIQYEIPRLLEELRDLECDLGVLEYAKEHPDCAEDT